MKRILCLLLALAMLCTCIALASCSETEGNAEKDGTSDAEALDGADDTKSVDLHALYDAVNEKLPFDGLVRDVCYKENDEDELINWTYGLIETSCYEKVVDYVITLPSDYNQSFAAVIFEDGISDEELDEVKTAVTEEYIRGRASSLQMYMPEEYEVVKWQLQNPEAIWRQYDNVLVLLMYGAEEPSEGWAAVDAFFK